MAMRPISFLSAEQLEDYGTTEIKALCDFYGSPQTVSWKEGGRECQNTSQPLIDSEEVLQEWQLLKRVVIAEQYPRDSMWQLWGLIVKFHPEFPNLTILAKLALTCSVHTAGCERGFSVQNRILTTFRNRLTIQTQQQLMKVKLDESNQGNFNFDAALSKWKQSKDRRIFEVKKLQ